MKLKTWLMPVIACCFLLVAPVYADDAININTATVKELQSVKGIGPKTAAAIVEYRNQHGAFKNVNDLVKVKGVGKKTLQKISDDLTVSDKKAPRQG